MTLASWWKVFLVQALISLVMVVAICAAAGGYVVWKINHWASPPDSLHLQEVFTAKRRLFEQLVRMTAEDAQGTVTVGDGVCSFERISPARVQEYRSVAAAIDPELKFSMACGRAASFTFEENTFGLAIGSHFANGIEYVPPDHEQYVRIVKSIGEAKALHLTEYWVPLSDHWYLFHLED